VAADAWSDDVAAMPEGVNHAASATDGTLLFVAGGRKGPNRVGPGYDFFQVYDPATNAWELGPPLPEARGGMGKAVFWGGELYVIGGESDQNGPDDETGLTSSNVYDRVDVFNLTSMEWRLVRLGSFSAGERGLENPKGAGTLLLVCQAAAGRQPFCLAERWEGQHAGRMPAAAPVAAMVWRYQVVHGLTHSCCPRIPLAAAGHPHAAAAPRHLPSGGR
jgi:hypothetical protein